MIILRGVQSSAHDEIQSCSGRGLLEALAVCFQLQRLGTRAIPRCHHH